MNINKWERRIIVLASDLQIESFEHSKSGLEILKNTEITILPINKSDIFNNEFTLLGGISPEPGMLLMMSPYDDNTYVEIEQARNLIAIEKASLTLRLCYLLGAKSVSVKNIKIVDSEKNKELSLDPKYNVVKGSLTAKMSVLENIKNQINVNGSFTGGKPNFEKAEILLKSSRLITDPLLKNLFEMVKDSFETENKITDLIQEVSLTQSLQKTFELAAKLDFPAGAVSGNYKSISNEKIEIFLGLEIKF